MKLAQIDESDNRTSFGALHLGMLQVIQVYLELGVGTNQCHDLFGTALIAGIEGVVWRWLRYCCCITLTLTHRLVTLEPLSTLHTRCYIEHCNIIEIAQLPALGQLYTKPVKTVIVKSSKSFFNMVLKSMD